MGLGAVVLLAVGLALQGLPPLTLAQWLIVAWLAVVNTAFAFTLWNHTQRTLSAMESSVINSTLIAQIPVLAWLFLGEALTPQKLLGIALAGAGALIVQLWGRRHAPERAALLERSVPGRPE
jgi:drug/metabolite transporter (DMT)-like permease